jgi:PAS domain S-box-containing protein
MRESEIDTIEKQRRRKSHGTPQEPSRILEAFFKHTLNPLVFLDREFRFIRVNEAYAKTCQRDVADFPGHNHFEFYPHEENEAIFREAVRSKTSYQAVAKPFTFPDHPEWGTTFWDWTLVPILDSDGEVEFLVFSLVDVTKRTEAKRRDAFTRKLLESFSKTNSRKEYLDALVEMVRDWSGCQCLGIRVLDDLGNIPYESYVGFTREFWELENSLSLKKDACVCTRIISQSPDPHNGQVMTPGGSFRCDNAPKFVQSLSAQERTRYRANCVKHGFTSIAVVPVRYHGQTLGAIHIADPREGMVPPANVEFLESMSPMIGEAIHRFSVEDQLRGAYSYARGLLEASLDPLVTINSQGEITDVNKATEHATGVSREQLIGSVFSDYFTEPRKASEGYQMVLSKGFLKDYPLTMRHASGSMADVLYNATVYRNEAGQAQGVFAAARDITQRKQAEENLKTLHKSLEQRAAQLQTMATELTLAEQRERRRLAQLLHDQLQQSLYAARLGVSTLRRRAQDEELREAMQHMDGLLGQCIAESRSLTMQLSPPILYDGGLAAALEWLARQMQQNHELVVEVDADPDAEPAAEDVRVLLFHSVRELLFNVVKHSGVRRAKVEMSSLSDNRVQIIVSDEGAGFSQTQHDVGQAFTMGFGLFGMRERLEIMGGCLEVSTTPGKGTVVMISAPLQQPSQAAVGELPPERMESEFMTIPTPESELAGLPRKIRVMLADDHAIFRRGLVDMLQQEADIDVVAEAVDGEMAVDLALRLHPDVVLMDVTMPRVDGVEATRRVSAILPGVRIIGLSAHEADDMAELMLKAGAGAYVSKSCPPENLIDAIRGAMSD